MSSITLALLIFGMMLVLMAVRVPIAAAMFIPGALGYWALTNDAALLNLLKGSAVARLQTELYTSLDQSDRAVEAGLEYLRRAGVDEELARAVDEAGERRHLQFRPNAIEAQLHVGLRKRKRMIDRHSPLIFNPLVHAPEVAGFHVQAGCELDEADGLGLCSSAQNPDHPFVLSSG